jgi:rhodanese-related sulfurtransferase
MPVKNPDEPFTRLTVQEAKEKIDRGEAQFVDVREMHEYTAGHATGTQHIPLNSVMSRINELAEDRDIVFICQKGQRSALAAEYAAAGGRTRLFNLEGGTDAWQAAGYPIEK